MILVNLEGPAEALDEFTLQCSEYLHSPGEREGKKQDEKNPYSGLLAKIEKVAANSGIALERQNVRALTASEEEIRRFTDEFYDGFCDMQSRLQALEESVARCRDVVTQLRHLQGMGLRFENIFSTRFLKVRFGKLPVDSEEKLCYYQDHVFLFFPFLRGESYIWGAYFTTEEYESETDNIFAALFFERVWVPQDIRGTPREELEGAKARLQHESGEYDKLSESFRRLVEENRAKLIRLYSETKFLARSYDMRGMLAVYSGRFYVTGFVQKDEIKKMEKAAGLIEDVKLQMGKPTGSVKPAGHWPWRREVS